MARATIQGATRAAPTRIRISTLTNRLPHTSTLATSLKAAGGSRADQFDGLVVDKESPPHPPHTHPTPTASLSLSLTHTHTHTNTHARTHTHTQTHTHTHTHTRRHFVSPEIITPVSKHTH